MTTREQGARNFVEAARTEQWVQKQVGSMPLPGIGTRHLAMYQTTDRKKPKSLFIETIANDTQTLASHITYRGSGAVIEMHYAFEGQYIFPSNAELGLPPENPENTQHKPQFRLLFEDSRRQIEYMATYSEGKVSLMLFPLIKSESSTAIQLANVDGDSYNALEIPWKGRRGLRRKPSLASPMTAEPKALALKDTATFTQGEHTLFIGEALRPHPTDSFIQAFAHIAHVINRTYAEKEQGNPSIFPADSPNDERFIQITKRVITPDVSRLISSLTVPIALDEQALLRTIASPDNLLEIARGLQVFIEGHYSLHKGKPNPIPANTNLTYR